MSDPLLLRPRTSHTQTRRRVQDLSTKPCYVHVVSEITRGKGQPELLKADWSPDVRTTIIPSSVGEVAN
jgi:hypothetical protein